MLCRCCLAAFSLLVGIGICSTALGPNLKDDGGQKERPGGDDVVLKIER